MNNQTPSTLPTNNGDYTKLSYWNERYESEVSFEWLVGYDAIRDMINKHIAKCSRILILGCGNSLLGEQLYHDGYTSIHCIDYSETVIGNMSKHCDTCARLEWSVMDARKLTFECNHFDAVIEKATFDAMLANEKDPWHLSRQSELLMTQILQEVSRVLRKDGKFVSISFSQPHFRSKVYIDRDYGWHLEDEIEIGTAFHYYYYHLIKSGKWKADHHRLIGHYEPQESELCDAGNGNGNSETSALAEEDDYQSQFGQLFS